MKLLKSKRAWQIWSKKIETSQSDKLDEPTSFPCFAYLVVRSFGYEEEAAKYLYTHDVCKMARTLGFGLKRLHTEISKPR